MPRKPLLDRLGEYIAVQNKAVPYSQILNEFQSERTCQISSCLRRLQVRNQVEYKAGLYYMTDLGREEYGEQSEDA